MTASARFSLYTFLARVGDVHVRRDRLTLLASDLGVSCKDLDRLVINLLRIGRASINGEEILLRNIPVDCARAQTRVIDGRRGEVPR